MVKISLSRFSSSGKASSDQFDVSFVSENPRPDGWPGNQQPDQEGDEAILI